MEVTVHVPDDFEEKTDSFLVSFANGQLVPSSSTKPSFTLYHKNNDRSKKRKIMVAETNHLSYIGTNYDPDSVTTAGSSTCRYCVGAVDRETGVMTLHMAEQFTLKPCIPGVATTEMLNEEETPKKQDYQQTVDQMVKLFGSEKQKRAFSAAKRNLVEAGALESALTTALSQAEKEIEEAASDSVTQQNSGLMPPYNLAAEVPQDVYNLENIISLSELKLLKKTAKVFTKATVANIKQWREENSFPEYVFQHISSLPSSEPHKSLKAAILLYITFLMAIHSMKGRKFGPEGFRFQSVVVPPPPDVNKQLLSKFTERQVGGGRDGKDAFILSARMKDKIRLHLFVLTLILDDFTVECASLQQDLKLTTVKMMDHFRALGCTVSKSAVKRKIPDDDNDGGTLPSDTVTSCTAVLKIPLNFPKPRKGRKQKQS